MNNIKNKVEYRRLDELELLENNPRTITKEKMERLIKSIKENKEYFEARPIICSNRTGRNIILAGNQRWRAAKIIGMQEVPTVILEGLDEEKEKEIIIRDNVELGNWDFNILANEWDENLLEEWGGKELLGGVGNGLVDKLKEGKYVEKEEYFIKKPFVVIFYDDFSKNRLEGLLGLEIDNDTYDAANL